MLNAVFRSGLRREAKRCRVRGTQECDASEGDKEAMSLSLDEYGFCWLSRWDLGRLCALLFAQAEFDGASRIQFHYGSGRMVYTLGGVDHDMVAPPAPLYADFVRGLARAAKVRQDSPGALHVVFADDQVELTVMHCHDTDEPYLEVRGLTGRLKT